MKTLKILLSVNLILLLINGISQNTIWTEDFEAYADNTGYIGTNSGAATSGDYPASVSKWTLDVTGGSLSNKDWFMVNDISGNKLFEANDTDGPCIWLSESVDISSYVDVSFFIQASESGTLEDEDYIDVEYKIGAGNWELIPNLNGENTTHTLRDDFSSIQISLTGLYGSTLQIRMTMDVRDNNELLRVDDILVEGVYPSAPTAYFFADKTTPTTQEIVNLIDLSVNYPTSWDWVITPSTATYISGDENTQNPQVKFNQTGLYSISLTVNNAAGSDTYTRINYINVAEQTSPWSITTPGTYYFTVPNGVYSIDAKAYGGGGGGSGTHTVNGADDGGGGGGGAGYSGGTLAVSSGDILTVVVGAGGNGGDDNQNGESGSISSVTHNLSNESVIANGGDGAESINNGGSGGSGGIGICTGGVFNPVSFTGGLGADGTKSVGGGAGGGAGDSNDGSPGSGTIGGFGGIANGGDGGDGSTNDVAGGNGSLFGGGGGGASDNGPSTGGNGADGAVIISWTPATVWTGITSTDWNAATNWNENVVPTVGEDILIPSSPNGTNYPETNSGTGAESGSLIIQSGAHVYIPFDNTLTVNERLINKAGNSGLVIQSTVSGTGSLIHNTNGVNATVKQFISEDSWHYVSSPISNATSNVFYDIYLKPFNEPTYTWGDYIISTTEGLNVMQGYSAWTYDPITVSFQGILNNGSQNINVSYTPQTNPGWNFVGNPYPSALDWNAPGWDKTNIDNTIYFYEGDGNGGVGNYKYYVGSGGSAGGVGTATGSGIIPAMQGFFVKATANSTLSVTNSARVHSDQAYYKEETDNDIPIVRLAITDINGLTDEAIIRFYEEATIEHDGNYDAYKLFGWMYPQLYSITPENSELAINTLPACKNETIIPLGFLAPEDGEYSISLSQFDNFESSTKVYIEDLFTNEMISLAINEEYLFSSSPEDLSERFNLHFNVASGIDDSIPDNDVHIYSYENKVFINSPGSLINEIIIVDILGHEIFRKTSYNTHEVSQSLRAKAGYFIVQVMTETGVFTQKVFIK